MIRIEQGCLRWLNCIRQKQGVRKKNAAGRDMPRHDGLLWNLTF